MTELSDREMREKVARAIADREADIYGRTVTDWDDLPPRWHEHYRCLADAAIDAMRAEGGDGR